MVNIFFKTSSRHLLYNNYYTTTPIQVLLYNYFLKIVASINSHSTTPIQQLSYKPTLKILVTSRHFLPYALHFYFCAYKVRDRGQTLEKTDRLELFPGKCHFIWAMRLNLSTIITLYALFLLHFLTYILFFLPDKS